MGCLGWLNEYLAWNGVGLMVSACQMLTIIIISSNRILVPHFVVLSLFMGTSCFKHCCWQKRKKKKENLENPAIEGNRQEKRTGDSLRFGAGRDWLGPYLTDEEVKG